MNVFDAEVSVGENALDHEIVLITEIDGAVFFANTEDIEGEAAHKV